VVRVGTSKSGLHNKPASCGAAEALVVKKTKASYTVKVPTIQQYLRRNFSYRTAGCLSQHLTPLLQDLSKTIKILNKTTTQLLLNVPRVWLQVAANAFQGSLMIFTAPEH
jgi:hypothetical protein